MICKKCGKKLDDGARFCMHCGASVDHSVQEAPPQERETLVIRNTARKAAESAMKQENRKKLIAALVAVAVLLGGGAALRIYFSPASAMNRAIAADNFEEALSLYHEELSGRELPDQSVAKLTEATARAAEEYEADEISYEEAANRLNTLNQFWDADLNAAMNAAWQRVNAKWELESQLAYAAQAIENKEYTTAISMYEEILAQDIENAAAQAGVQEARNALRQTALTSAQDYQKKGDFQTAAAVLEDTLNGALSGDADLQAALDGLGAAETAYTIEKAYAATEAGEWDEALEMLETYQEKKGLSDELKRAYEDIEKKRPITLLNLTMVSSDSVEIMDKVIKDRWGNVYDRGVRYDAMDRAYGYYALEKKYTRFLGNVFPSERMGNAASVSVAIYTDDKLSFYQDGVTVNTPPISFEIDVSGATTLKIVTDNQNWDWDGYLDFGNTHFEKVGEAQQGATAESKVDNTNKN